MKCRHCGQVLTHEFVNLFNAPPSNAYLTENQLNEPEVCYPLKIFVCDKCFLVQIDEYKKSNEIFDDNYAYFSSYSSSWLDHAKKYVDKMEQKLQLTSNSFVVEIASNDGYLLQYVKEKNIPCLGIEPTASTAQVAKNKGINTLEIFFNSQTATTIDKADLILGNNVLAHVPDINDFVKGLKITLKPKGTITMEFPHLLNLIKFNQFDTIYHEHFSYLSLMTVQTIFNSQGLKIYDVDVLPTHGGSLRIYATHVENNIKIEKNVEDLIEKEKCDHLDSLDGYKGFDAKIRKIKWDFWNFLTQVHNNGEKIVAYGAAAKGNTFLNYCGVKADAIPFVVDASPHKQNKFLPMSHIPVRPVEQLKTEKMDYILILPWNIRNEIICNLKYVNGGVKWVTAIPNLNVWEEK